MGAPKCEAAHPQRVPLNDMGVISLDLLRSMISSCPEPIRRLLPVEVMPGSRRVDPSGHVLVLAWHSGHVLGQTLDSQGIANTSRASFGSKVLQ